VKGQGFKGGGGFDMSFLFVYKSHVKSHGENRVESLIGAMIFILGLLGLRGKV